MAGITNNSVFIEKISPFLREKLKKIKSEYGESSAKYKAIYLQYVKQDIEDVKTLESNERHWQADMKVEACGEHILKGLERLYNQSLVIEPTMICAAHCRYCLRGNYDIFTLTEKELIDIAKYCGSAKNNPKVTEVLVTGGDPLIIPRRLNVLVEALLEHAPNVKTMRIATRLPQHAPDRINNNTYEIFRRNKEYMRFEIATQTNHAVELFPETIDVFENLQAMGLKIYSQNVILKGVNDKIDILVDLYRKMRELDIEPHYLFHSIPIKGMHHFRTSLAKALELSKQLTNSGLISGRVKPMFALLTDIGKIIIYDGTILKKQDGRILLQSSYRLEDRLKYNPSWSLPETAEVDENGLLRVWYLDGNDD